MRGDGLIMSSGDPDLNEKIKEILKRMNDISKCVSDDPYSSYQKDKPSNALVTVPGCTPQDNSGFGGDPRNSYRELRRYLLMLGIDTRIFSFGTIPIPVAINESRKALPTLALDLGTLDNCFHFELRKVIEPGARGEKVNSLVLMVRVFFEGGQQNNNFWVQMVLNHHRDAVLELNRVYSKIIPTLTAGSWSQPTAGREGSRVTFFEKRFMDVSDFKHEFSNLYDDFKVDGLTGSYMEHG
jgi:hypothetical protein